MGDRGHNRHGPKIGLGIRPLPGESRTGSPGPRPTSIPSDILIHPTVWPQYTNVTDRQTDRQRSDTKNKTLQQIRYVHDGLSESRVDDITVQSVDKYIRYMQYLCNVASSMPIVHHFFLVFFVTSFSRRCCFNFFFSSRAKALSRKLRTSL